MKSPRKSKALLYAAYVAFFIVSFVLFAYWSFPYDRVKAYVIQEVERPMGPGHRRIPSGWELEIVDLSPSWGTGVELTGVRLAKQAEDPDEQPIDLTIENVTARISLLSLLAGDTALSFDATLAGGEVEGEYEETDDATSVEAHVRGIHLRRLGVLRNLTGLPIAGTLAGDVDVTLAENIRQTQGDVGLNITGLTIGGGKLKVGSSPMMREGLTVEQVQAGDLALRIHVENGNGEVQELSAHGADAVVAGSGTIRLVRPVKMSRLDLLLRVELTDAYKHKSPVTERLFTALEMIPEVRPVRTPDGAFQFRLSGAVAGRMGFAPAGRSPPPGGAHAPAGGASDR